MQNNNRILLKKIRSRRHRKKRLRREKNKNNVMEQFKYYQHDNELSEKKVEDFEKENSDSDKEKSSENRIPKKNNHRKIIKKLSKEIKNTLFEPYN